MTVQYHPLDVSSLKKGDLVTNDAVEKILGILQSAPRFKLKCVNLAKWIAKQLETIGRPATVRALKDGIKVLTDAEALEYNPRRFKNGLRLAGRSHRRLMATDVSALTRDQQRTHERAVLTQGMILGAVASTRAKMVLRATERKTPAITAGT